jgi:hypothetical protein
VAYNSGICTPLKLGFFLVGDWGKVEFEEGTQPVLSSSKVGEKSEALASSLRLSNCSFPFFFFLAVLGF